MVLPFAFYLILLSMILPSRVICIRRPRSSAILLRLEIIYKLTLETSGFYMVYILLPFELFS